ncbi:MAG TPA: hypothetical protein VN176_12095 [Verrucomicrobiae bacterium]|jgi:hypothetical protein|nr:hypothetical protein [Verrucomicrobiae bacterium]
MDKLSFTLYEFFGYFLPGVVGVSAITILFWTLFLPVEPVPIHVFELSKLWYFGLAVVAYYAGHVLQAISRSLFKNPDDSILASQADMAPLVKRARAQLATHLSLTEPETPSSGVTVRLCDELALQYGQLGDRDVFVYREGFYRGSFASFILLDLALVVRAIVPGATLLLPTKKFPVSCWQLIFFIAVVTVSIFFLKQRYKHFAALRVMRGILAYVSLSCFHDLGKKGNDGTKG